MGNRDQAALPQRRVGVPKSYQKWGIDVVRGGYTLIPKALMEINLYLDRDQKLTPVEIMTVFIIVSTWNDPHRFPAASKSFIADRLNITSRQVQKVIARLVEKQVLRRYPGDKRTGFANEYWLTGILDAVRKIQQYERMGDLEKNEHQFQFSFTDGGPDDVPF